MISSSSSSIIMCIIIIIIVMTVHLSLAALEDNTPVSTTHPIRIRGGGGTVD